MELREKIGRIIGDGFVKHDNIFELADAILDLPEIKEALELAQSPLWLARKPDTAA